VDDAFGKYRQGRPDSHDPLAVLTFDHNVS
jgi:hypothetical protein